ncbi:hypothetical protein BGZ65_005322 [Modicella reniformis]|uniref:XPG-I domain-containing protein n=1 Tax=Modicella reniformis TaxID=1440133 RepID=A0A9P6SSZ6_9FUNG|nr:hypothetical protein BGZ65_005322 [Modicella reniformis]
MGIVGLWPLLQKYGYTASAFRRVPLVPEPATSDESTSEPAIRVDILGSFFPSIRRAYATHTSEAAHSAVEQALLKSGIPKTAVLYLDGEPTAEKEHTHVERAARRSNAAQRAQGSIGGKSKAASSLRIIPVEADVAIANDCQSGDLVVSSDSDMLAYGSVQSLVRPFRGQYLRYDLAGVSECLSMSREQLTALAVVCRNDYNRNIVSLGPQSNYKLIKTLNASEDAETLVKHYLKSSEVVRKNTSDKHFENAIKVSSNEARAGEWPIRRKSHVVLRPQHRLRHMSRFNNIREQLRVNQQQRPDRDVAVDASQKTRSSNMYRTVDKGPAQCPPHQSPNKNRLRKRYSFKSRTRRVEHPQPDTMHMYKWKPWNKYQKVLKLAMWPLPR